MKRLAATLLTLCLLVTLVVPACYADGLLGGLFGGDSSLPSLKGKFDGETVTVKINGTRYEVHKDFKEAMDSYEEFMDAYIRIMTAKNPDMTEYTRFLGEYAVAMAALEGVNENKLSDGDAAYYLMVMERINTKLLKVIQ